MINILEDNKLKESASEAILPSDDSDEMSVIASQVALNLKGEWDAIEGYMKLIPWFRKHNDENSIRIIEIIIAEEKKHTNLLYGIQMKYDGSIVAEE